MIDKEMGKLINTDTNTVDRVDYGGENSGKRNINIRKNGKENNSKKS